MLDNPFSLSMTLGFQSPAVENFIEIDGRTYATGKNGRKLYRLVPVAEARFTNEAVLVSETFKYDVRYELRNAIEAELNKEI